MRALAWLALVAVVVAASPRAFAQECRYTCRFGEVHDAAGCCVAPTAGGDATTTPPVRCPAGTRWSAHERACVGRLVCRVGSHAEPDRGCVADAVACPAGSRLAEGRCVADVSCPPDTRPEGDACVGDVTCPAGTRLEGGRCVSSDVTCPDGTRPREGGGCAGDPVCPTATHFVEGRGCLGELVCPRGTHADRGGCAPDQSCLDGTRYVEGRGCVDACEGYAHASWSSERGVCSCDGGYVAQGNACVATGACEPGMHAEGARGCVADVACPYGYRFVRGEGCVDPRGREMADADRQREERDERFEADVAAQRTRERAGTAWMRGPAVQLWAGGGAAYVVAPGGVMLGSNAVTQRWGYGGVRAGADLSFEDLVLGASFTAVTTTAPDTSTPAPASPMYLAMLEFGGQGAGVVHTWRLLGGFGYEFTGERLAAEFAYRSLFRLAAGFFVGFEFRLLGLLAVGAPSVDVCTNSPCGSPASGTVVNTSLAGGGTASLFVGYSIH